MILKTNSDFYPNSVNEFVVMEEQCAFHETETELLNTIHIIVMLNRVKPVESATYRLPATQNATPSMQHNYKTSNIVRVYFQQFVSVNKINTG